MEPAELRKMLSGVIAFPITPFKNDLGLDLEGLRGNLIQLAQHPICAVVAAGGTGEIYSLTPAEYLQLIKTTVAVIEGRRDDVGVQVRQGQEPIGRLLLSQGRAVERQLVREAGRVGKPWAVVRVFCPRHSGHGRDRMREIRSQQQQASELNEACHDGPPPHPHAG